MATEADVVNKLTTLIRTIAQEADGVPGTIVALSVDGATASVVVPGQTNNVWVKRFGGEPNEVYPAYNIAGVKPLNGMPVYVKERNGVFEVTGLRPAEGTQAYGVNAPYLAGTPDSGELTGTIWPGRNSKPGRVRLATANSTILHVEAFWYRHYGTIKRFPGGIINMSSYLPSTTNYWHWALLGVWGKDNSIYVVTGDETANYNALTDTALATVTTNAEGLVPCDAVKLQQGMTAIDREDYFAHGRLSAAETGLSAVPTSVDSDYYHIPANRRILWSESMTVTGRMVIQGQVIIQ